VGGDSQQLNPEVYKARLQVGDTLLLCSDGLTKHVSDSDMATLLDNSSSAEDACRQFVDAANQAGGSDNITVVIARFEETSEQTLVAQAESVLEKAIEKTDPHADTVRLVRPDGAEVAAKD
jgi:protein phosphatase